MQVALHPVFEYTMLALILVSSIQLCLDSPTIDPNGKLKLALKIMDYIFVVAFGLEALMKVCEQRAGAIRHMLHCLLAAAVGWCMGEWQAAQPSAGSDRTSP